MEETLDRNFVVQSEVNDFTYPLEFEFKIGTLANDFVAKDANGGTVAYVRQKMFKFKEAIQVFADENKATQLYSISADRVIDFNANYAFTTASGDPLGRVGRRGARSIFNAHYQVFDKNGELEYSIREENPWAKFWDALLCELPLVGLFSGYFFNPRYTVKTNDDVEVVKLSKESSFWGRRFKLEKTGELTKDQGERILLALMMMTLLERRRG